MVLVCCRAGAAALLAANLAWLGATLRYRAEDPPPDLARRRVLAFGTAGLALALASGSLQAPSLTMPAATVALMCSATSTWYASALVDSPGLWGAGHGVALLATASALLLVAAATPPQPPPPPPPPPGTAAAVVVSPMHRPDGDARTGLVYARDGDLGYGPDGDARADLVYLHDGDLGYGYGPDGDARADLLYARDGDLLYDPDGDARADFHWHARRA